MRLISFYISVPFFVGIYLLMYPVVVTLLLTGTLFKNKIRSGSYNLLFVFNTLVAWCSLFLFIFYVAELFMAWYGQNPYEWYAFRENGNSGHWTWFYIISLLSFLMGLLFFIRKLRIKRWFSLFFLLSLSGSFFEKIVIFITNQYRDYLPSAWTDLPAEMYYQYMVSFVIIVLLLVLIYVWAKKKGTLPYPSVFLK